MTRWGSKVWWWGKDGMVKCKWMGMLIHERASARKDSVAVNKTLACGGVGCCWVTGDRWVTAGGFYTAEKQHVKTLESYLEWSANVLTTSKEVLKFRYATSGSQNCATVSAFSSLGYQLTRLPCTCIIIVLVQCDIHACSCTVYFRVNSPSSFGKSKNWILSSVYQKRSDIFSSWRKWTFFKQYPRQGNEILWVILGSG